MKEGTLITGTDYEVHFQNNIQSIFSRVRLLYGSTPLEDLNNYNQIVRNLSEWTATAGNDSLDQTSIAEGMGGISSGVNPVGNIADVNNIRASTIQSIDKFTASYGFTPNENGTSPNQYSIRRYQIQFALGLFNQGKLLPAKFMASQLAIELTLATEAQCLICSKAANLFSKIPSYELQNVNLIPEILEFDASYGIYNINERCNLHNGASERRSTD